MGMGTDEYYERRKRTDAAWMKARRERALRWYYENKDRIDPEKRAAYLKQWRANRKGISLEEYICRASVRAAHNVECRQLLAEGKKRCPHCQQIKTLSDFGAHRAGRDGLTSWCRECHCADSRQINARPEIKARRRDQRLQKTHGISASQKDAMLAAQCGRCAICGDTEPGRMGWATDHDHRTGQVRGILCNACNTGIGLLGDDPSTLETAAAYLRRWQNESQPLNAAEDQCDARPSVQEGKER